MMHKIIPKELMLFIAIFKCHVGSLKKEVKRVLCRIFREAIPVHVGKKMS